MRCNQCGMELKGNQRFCPRCGERIEETEDISPKNEYRKQNTTELERKEMKVENFEQWKKNKSKICLAVTITILVLAAGIAIFNKIYFSPYNQFNRAFSQSDYVTASNIYGEEMSYDEKARNKAYLRLQDKINEIKRNYIEEKIGYNIARESLNELVQNNLAVEDAQQAMTELSDLNQSKLAFQEGNEQYKNGDFRNAIDSYDKVIEADVNYTVAQETREKILSEYKTQILDMADKNVKNNNYEEALRVLKEATDLLSVDSDFMKIRGEIEEKAIEKKKVDLLAEASKKEQAGKYYEAFKQLKNANDFLKDTEVQNKKQEYQEKYVNQVMEEAYKYLKENDIGSAISVLNLGMQDIPNNEPMQTLLEECNLCIPVNLTELNCFEVSGKKNEKELSWGEFTDNVGNSDYESGFKYGISSANYESSRTYLLDGKYDNFSAVLAVNQSCKKDYYQKDQARLILVADGNVLYTSDSIHGGDTPIKINTSISGVNKLEVKMQGTIGHYWGWGSFYVGLLDCKLSKNLPKNVVNVNSDSEEKQNLLLDNYNIDKRISEIRTLYYGIENNSISLLCQDVNSDITYYYTQSNPEKITVKKGYIGKNYTRQYYYENGKLYFAFIYIGNEEYRAYYEGSNLIRFINKDGVIFDYGNLDGFSDWDKTIQSEASEVYNISCQNNQ